MRYKKSNHRYPIPTFGEHILSTLMRRLYQSKSQTWQNGSEFSDLTRLTCNPINLFKNDPFLPATRLTRPDLLVFPRLPMLSRLRLRCNSYKIFIYSSLLNMLCIPLQFVILYLTPSFSLPTLNSSKIIPRLASRKQK